MNSTQIANSIYTCKVFEDRDVSDDILNRAFQLVRAAPSTKNLNGWQFIVVRNQETQSRLVWESFQRTFGCDAPVTIACCIQSNSGVSICGHPAYTIEIAAGIEHLDLALAAQGLTTCWIGSFDERKIKEILSIPDNIRVAEMLVVGHPGERPGSQDREYASEIVRYEKW